MEFAKLEEVQGLKFQHALVVPRSSYTSSGVENTLSSLVVSKYNVLIQYGGPIAKFYHLPKVIDTKGLSDDNLLMTLDVGSDIESMVNGSTSSSSGNNGKTSSKANMNRSSTSGGNGGSSSTSNCSGNSGNGSGRNASNLDLEDVLLIETNSSLYVYSLINHSYLYTYRKPSNVPKISGGGDKAVNRRWYRITSADESLMLLVVDGAGTLELINVRTGSTIIQIKLLGHGLHHTGLGIGLVIQNQVKLIGNVDSNRILIVTRSDKLYLVDLSVDSNSVADRNRVFQLTIKPTRSGSNDTVTETLNGDYKVVGCHMVNDTVLLAIIAPFYDDNMVLMCNLDTDSSGNKELTPLGYCYNEFYMTKNESEGVNGTNTDDEAWIFFKHIQSWDLFIAYSNRSTSPVLITCNRRLREANSAATEKGNKSLTLFDGELVLGTNTTDPTDEDISSEYNVLMMSEGYCLESNEFEKHVLDVFVYANYKNEIYRNSSLEDTPTLKDPVVVGLVIETGDVSMFYVDRHIIGADNKEDEIMCELYNKERDLTISSCVVNNDVDGGSSNEGSGGRSIGVGKSTGQGNMASTSSGGVDDGIPSVNVQKFLAKYYKDGFRKYRKDKRLFKLHEAFCNSLEYFNSSLDHVLKADDSVVDGSPIRVSKSIASGYNANCKLDKLKDYNLIIKKLLNIQQDLGNDLYRISAPGSPLDANHGGASGSETPLPLNADLNGFVNGKDSGKELMDKMYNLLDNLSLQSMESVTADNLNEVESTLMYINSSLNSLYRRFEGLENRLLDVHNQMVFNEIAGGYVTNTWLAKQGDQLPDPTPTHSPANSYEGVSRAGRSTSVVERKLNRLVDDIVSLYNRPLLDLSSEFGNLWLRNGSSAVSGGTSGEGSSVLGGGTKLKYNNYDVLFKGSGGSLNLPSFSISEKSSARNLFSGSRMASSESKKSSTLTSSGEGNHSTLVRGSMAATSATLIEDSSAATAAGSPKTLTSTINSNSGVISGPTKTGIPTTTPIAGIPSTTGIGGNLTKTGIGVGIGTGDKDLVNSLGATESPKSFGTTGPSTGVDKGDGSKTSIFGSSIGGTAAPDTSAAIGASPGGDRGEPGKAKFGLTTSLLSGYNLMPSSLETANASGTPTPSGIGRNLNSSSPSGTSAFAGFNTNKSLLDIALNSSSQVASTATNTLGGAFPTTASGGTAGGVGGSFLNSSNNAGIGTSNLGAGNNSLLSPGSPSALLRGSSSPFGVNSAGGGSLSPVSGSVSRGSFTGAGNFAANSFPASSSMFGSNPSSDNSSLYNQGGGNAPTASSTSIFGGNSNSVFSGGTSSSGIPFFNTSPGTVTDTTGSNSTIGSGGIFGTNPPGANLGGDLWGTSRRSNPLD